MTSLLAGGKTASLVLAFAAGAGCSGGSAPPAPSGYLIGGTITALRGSGLTLHLNRSVGAVDLGALNLQIPAGGAHFTFPERESTGTWFDLTIISQPAAQKCFVDGNHSNYVESRDITDLRVVCSAPGGFLRTGAMVDPSRFSGHTATLLVDGRVLIAGGASWPTNGPLATAELYDPGSRTFAATGSMHVARVGHTATLLSDGRVLMVGGGGGTAAEIYDPATGTFVATGEGTVAREWGHSATRLSDGRVLVAGGQGGSVLASAELFDALTGGFTPTGSLAGPSYSHFATLLPNGEVLVAAGDGLDRAQLYDPTTGTFALTGSMLRVRAAPAASALRDGTVLVVGGAGPPYGDYQLTAEVYDPIAGAFGPTGDALACHPKATLLQSGKVLLSGWVDWTLCFEPNSYIYPTDGEVYDPATGSFLPTVDMVWDRSEHTATSLADGSVLIVGGAPIIDPVAPPSPEIFLPQ